MLRRTLRLQLRLSLLLLAIPPVVIAQTTGASLSGHAADESGHALRGVTISATNNATGFSRSTATWSDGSYTFPSLPAGTYTVVAELTGFASLSTRKVELNVATERKVNVTLKKTEVEEQITVTAEPPLIETMPGTSSVITERELRDLPLDDRQLSSLGSLAPATTLPASVLVDGGDNNDDTTGGALQNFTIEAVQEINIQAQRYKAEYGRTTGGVLTVVTKTGTNTFMGSAYELHRDKSDQYGASLGGPIIKDRAHFFVTGERTGRKTNYIVDTGGIYPSFDGQAVGTPFEDDLLTAKATGDINARQFLQVRYGYEKSSGKYGASPVILPSALGTITNNHQSILAGHTWQVSSNKFNELLFQNTHFKKSISAGSSEPALLYPSGVASGQSIDAPQSTVQHKRQFKDDFSWSHNLGAMRHDFKAGVNYIDEPVLGGDFSAGLPGQYTLARDVQGAPVTDITIFGGVFGDSTPIEQTNYYVQDDIIVNRKLTLNVGLRYDLWKGFDLDQRSNPIWQTLSTQTKYNEAYLRDFQGGKGGKLENDTDNWGPRIGFIWDMHGDSRNIVRGGAGRYFDFPYTNATILFPAAAVQSDYGVIYNFHDGDGIRNPNGTFFQPGQPLPPNQLPGDGAPQPNEIASPTLATPYSDQISLGYSWQVNPWLGLNIDASHIEYKDIPYPFRANPIDPTTGVRRFPAFGSFRLWYGNGRAKYDGLNLSGHARLGEKFEMQGFYTLSEATGNVLAGGDEFRLTAAGYQPDFRTVRDQSPNPYDPQCSACFGPLNNDARHRFTVSGLYRGPWDLSVAGILRYRSSTPYTDWSGVDLNGDGYDFDLPAGVSHVNSLRGASFSQFDVRVAKGFRFGDNFGFELIGEIFNLTNAKNERGFVGNRNSDSYKQPSYFAGDPGQGEQRLAQLGVRVTF